MQMMGMATQIRVLRFLITETGTYNPMYRRSYHTEMDAGTLMAIEEKVSNAKRITPQMLGGLADRFVLPSAAPEQMQLGDGRQVSRQLIIPGMPWNERRLRFMLEVETDYGVGGRITEIVQGYSDHLGVTNTGVIDPNMEFYVNSVLKVRKQTENTPFGAKSIFNVTEAAHVLMNPNQSGQLYNTDVTERMRPEDIFAAMDRQAYNNIGSFIDERTVQGAVPVLSPRKNGIPTNYLSQIMEGYQNAIIDPSNNAGNSMDYLSAARGYAASEPIQHDAFMKAIANIRKVPISNSFTFKDLFSLDPNIQHHTKYARTVAPQITVQSNFVGLSQANPWDMPHQAGNSGVQSWEASDGATHAAVILGNSVPGLLMDLALTGIHFTSTNRNLGDMSIPSGGMNTKVGNWESFSDFDMTNHIRAFISRFEREIMYGISSFNQMDYWVEMKVDLLGETWIKISINNGPFIWYNQPSFADALAVPVLTQDRQAVSNVVNDFDMFLTQVIKKDDYASNSGSSQFFV